jgi:predicted DCC family thiol-disulfide oxidoreductase YuxK
MNPTIIFDGDCIFCNRFINFVVQHDSGLFRLLDRNAASFAPIKNQFNITEAHGETIFVLNGNRCLEKTTAIRYILLRCGWKGKLAAAPMFLFPTMLRNLVYDFISRNRSKISPRFCKRPDPVFLSRMLP